MNMNMGYVTLHCHGNQITLAQETYEAKREVAYGQWLEAGFDNFEWSGYGQADFEADLFEVLMQQSIDEAEGAA